ncbi:MAG: DUF2298 domain-containing protein, partial [Chloroflexota bacterium]|nr:DUF2298 domain-containing protein [Chloroflexota bacterium]
MGETGALLRWLLAVEIAGWGLYPLLFLAVPGLRDRGLTVAKPFALLALTYPVWFLAALGLPVFTAPALLASLLLLSIVGWGLALTAPPRPPILGGATRRNRVLSPQSWGARGARAGGVLPFLRASWRYVLATEALFIGAFLGYAWLRGFSPEILGTEKPMEIGFLSAATRQDTMPPADPWLSGHGINYYYLGYAILAALAKLTGVSSSVAFNLGLATLFAATLTGGAGVTANLVAWGGEGRGAKGEGPTGSGQALDAAPGRWGKAQGVAPRARTLAAGLLGGYLLAIAGNMYAARDILDRGRAAIDASWWGGLGWKSSRVVVDRGFPAAIWGPNAPPSETINEFPFFSFILGDLHAHVLALPFTVLALALALDAWIAPPVPAGGEGRGTRGEERNARPFTARLPACPPARLALAALVIGALYALNSWDLPTYAAIYAAALVLPPLLRRGAVAPRTWGAAAAFGALCVALYLPFWAGFTSLVGGQPFDLPEPWRSVPGLSRLSATLGLVIWGKTPADQFFTVYLLPWTVGLIFLAWRWRAARPHRPAGTPSGWQTPALTVLALALGATVLRMPVFFLAGLIVALAVAALRRGACPEADRFATTLFGGAFALVLLTEVFFVHDVFGNRMNTVFKVYYQAWTLLAIAAGYAIVRAPFDLPRWRAEGGWRVPAAILAAILLLASTAYPIYGSAARTDRFAERQPLDGLEFVRASLPGEYAGIRWA